MDQSIGEEIKNYYAILGGISLAKAFLGRLENKVFIKITEDELLAYIAKAEEELAMIRVSIEKKGNNNGNAK